jgi:hypothetical protein
MFPIAPILIGAAVGAGTSALTGGNPFRGGLLGGVSGGLFGSGGPFEELLKKIGGPGSLLNGVGTNAVAGGDPVKGLMMNASALGGAQGFGAANTAQTAQSLVDQAVAAGTPVQAFAGTPGGMSPMTAALQEAAMRDPTGFASGITSLPASAAVPFGGSTGAQSIAQGEWDFLKQYMPSGQALGNLGLQAAMQPRPSVQAPAGGITQGRAPDIASIQNLIGSMRRKPTEGILGDYFG